MDKLSKQNTESNKVMRISKIILLMLSLIFMIILLFILSSNGFF